VTDEVGALVLAAGAGARMGTSKLTLAWRGRPVIAHVLASVADAGLPALVVTGAHAAEVDRAIGAVPRVHAPDHGLGLSASIRAGVAALPQAWSGFLVVLGDMPRVHPLTLRALADALRAGADAVVPVFRGTLGNPAGFARRHAALLMTLDGDRGARSLFETLGVTEVCVDDPGILLDLDRPGDFGAIG
jgi:molybdenum cofactor cytidylyltransferase